MLCCGRSSGVKSSGNGQREAREQMLVSRRLQSRPRRDETTVETRVEKLVTR